MRVTGEVVSRFPAAVFWLWGLLFERKYDTLLETFFTGGYEL
jgi:hypothetical protein